MCSTVCKEKSLTSDREELQLKTFSYHIDRNEEDEVVDPALNKPGLWIFYYKILQRAAQCAHFFYIGWKLSKITLYY